MHHGNDRQTDGGDAQEDRCLGVDSVARVKNPVIAKQQLRVDQLQGALMLSFSGWLWPQQGWFGRSPKRPSHTPDEPADHTGTV